MRGKPLTKAILTYARRNIPAYAGKTPSSALGAISRREHPRVCGENQADEGLGFGGAGTSPRMRGKPEGCCGDLHGTGNIPAYAGKTIRNSNMF